MKKKQGNENLGKKSKFSQVPRISETMNKGLGPFFLKSPSSLRIKFTSAANKQY